MPIHSRPVEPVTRLFSPECHIRGKGSGYGKPGGHPLISRFSRRENSFSSFPVSPDFSRGPATSSPQRSPGPCAYPFKKLSFHLQFIFGLRLYTSHRQLDKACLYRNLKTCQADGIIQLCVRGCLKRYWNTLRFIHKLVVWATGDVRQHALPVHLGLLMSN
jgi:hypothetical protein